MAGEVLAEHSFCFPCPTGSQQRGPERFADWIEPDWRLVVRQTVGGSHRIGPRGDCAIVLATRFRDAGVQHDAGNGDDGASAFEARAAEQSGFWDAICGVAKLRSLLLGFVGALQPCL